MSSGFSSFLRLHHSPLDNVIKQFWYDETDRLHLYYRLICLSVLYLFEDANAGEIDVRPRRTIENYVVYGRLRRRVDARVPVCHVALRGLRDGGQLEALERVPEGAQRHLRVGAIACSYSRIL